MLCASSRPSSDLKCPGPGRTLLRFTVGAWWLQLAKQIEHFFAQKKVTLPPDAWASRRLTIVSGHVPSSLDCLLGSLDTWLRASFVSSENYLLDLYNRFHDLLMQSELICMDPYLLPPEDTARSSLRYAETAPVRAGCASGIAEFFLRAVLLRRSAPRVLSSLSN